MLDTEHIVSTVKCKFNSKKCCSVDCCFVLGWWVECHVLCQQWYCACWSWWNTLSYEACCCTGDTRLGSVNHTMMTYLMQSFPKFHFKQNMHDNAAVSDGWLVLQKSGNYQKCKRIFAWQMLLKNYNGNKLTYVAIWQTNEHFSWSASEILWWHALCCNMPTMNNSPNLDLDYLVTSFSVETPISWNAC